MKRLVLLILPLALLLAAAAPSMALAEGSTAEAGQKWVDNADGGCKDGKCGKARERHQDGAAFRVYSMLTGKTVDELKKTCETQKLTIWQLAEREGRLNALKDRLVSAHSAGLDEMVKGGVLTEEQRGRIISHLKEELDKK